MIYSDQDIGRSYNKDELAAQLFQRMEEEYSRNYVLKDGEKVIARACTNAETSQLAVVAELIVE